MMGTVTGYNSGDVICIVTDGGTEMPKTCSYPGATWLRDGIYDSGSMLGWVPLMGAEGGNLAVNPDFPITGMVFLRASVSSSSQLI